MVRRRRRRMRKRSATVVPSSVREGSGPFIAFASVGIGVNEADKQRAQEDVEVEWHGPVLDIVEVVLHPVLHLFDSVRLAAEAVHRSEEHTSELQSLMRTSYAVFCLKNKNTKT